MSVGVLIKQKLFGKKTMPLDVILGEHLHYGYFENEQLTVGETGEHEFIAYHPDHIGRGFSVIWHPGEKKKIELLLPQPSTTQELRDFYDATERIVKYWNGKLTVDGTRTSLTDFLGEFDDMVTFNSNIIKRFSQEVLDGKHDTLTLYSAMWPLVIGKEEAALFSEDSDRYAQWLHERQSVDAYYVAPHFFADDDGIFSKYILLNDVPTIFPYQPTVPMGAENTATGEQLVCDRWLVLIGLKGDDAPLCIVTYDQFLSLVPESKKHKYDAAHFLLDALTEEEIRTLASRNPT